MKVQEKVEILDEIGGEGVHKGRRFDIGSAQWEKLIMAVHEMKLCHAVNSPGDYGHNPAKSIYFPGCGRMA